MVPHLHETSLAPHIAPQRLSTSVFSYPLVVAGLARTVSQFIWGMPESTCRPWTAQRLSPPNPFRNSELPAGTSPASCFENPQARKLTSSMGLVSCVNRHLFLVSRRWGSLFLTRHSGKSRLATGHDSKCSIISSMARAERFLIIKEK